MGDYFRLPFTLCFLNTASSLLGAPEGLKIGRKRTQGI